MEIKPGRVNQVVVPISLLLALISCFFNKWYFYVTMIIPCRHRIKGRTLIPPHTHNQETERCQTLCQAWMQVYNPNEGQRQGSERKTASWPQVAPRFSMMGSCSLAVPTSATASMHNIINRAACPHDAVLWYMHTILQFVNAFCPCK